jgi:hypothetical protein
MPALAAALTPLWEVFGNAVDGQGDLTRYMSGSDPGDGSAGGYAEAYRNANDSLTGFGFGFGADRSEVADGDATMDTGFGGGHLGAWEDRDGKFTSGGELGGGLWRLVSPLEGTDDPGFEAGVLTGGGHLTVSEQTASAGLQANLVETAMTVGDEENSFRFGGSLGAGAAARAHYGDADGDGVRELGFGLDLGPLSFDLKSEALGEAVDFAGDVLGGDRQNLADVVRWQQTLLEQQALLAALGHHAE